MKITNIRFYNGARERICRLGISNLFLEVLEIVLETPIYLLEEKDGNSGAVVRERIDEGFTERDWQKQQTGGIDWRKTFVYNLVITVTLGVEVQVSGRSDMVVRDLIHIRNDLRQGIIDVGVIIVPDDQTQVFLPDRTPSFKDAIRYIEDEFDEAKTYPLVVISVEHDGQAEEALPKRRTRS